MICDWGNQESGISTVQLLETRSGEIGKDKL